jgi:hypothetical protein
VSVHELVAAEMWLNATLSGDTVLTAIATGGVFQDYAPDGTQPPWVIFTLQSPGNDSLTLNAVRVMTNPLYQIVVVGPASPPAMALAVANAASELDTLMKRTSGTVVGGYIADCHRESPLTKSETINTVKWKSTGGLFRLAIEQTT